MRWLRPVWRPSAKRLRFGEDMSWETSQGYRPFEEEQTEVDLPPTGRIGPFETATLARLAGYAFLLSLAVLLGSCFAMRRLPGGEKILDQLNRAPIQTRAGIAPFEQEKGGTLYRFRPLYEYDLYGLVVSYHHSGSFFDISHKGWNDFANVKDICVIWGANLKDEIYRGMKFHSGDYTCFVNFDDADHPRARERFCEECLSNNHLIPADEDVHRAIMRAGVGDQIHLHGYLTEYSHGGGFKRGSSTRRDDKGNGACETIYVTDFTILEQGHPIARAAFGLTRFTTAIFFLAFAALWMMKPLQS